MYETNRKKNSSIRRVRPKREPPVSSWVMYKVKSRAGVEYVKYKFKEVPQPQGYNRQALRSLLAKDKQRKIDYQS